MRAVGCRRRQKPNDLAHIVSIGDDMGKRERERRMNKEEENKEYENKRREKERERG